MRVSTGKCATHANKFKNNTHYSGNVPIQLLRPIRAGLLQTLDIDQMIALIATLEPIPSQCIAANAADPVAIALATARGYVESIVAGNYTRVQLLDSVFWGDDTVTRKDGHTYVHPPRKRPRVAAPPSGGGGNPSADAPPVAGLLVDAAAFTEDGPPAAPPVVGSPAGRVRPSADESRSPPVADDAPSPCLRPHYVAADGSAPPPPVRGDDALPLVGGCGDDGVVPQLDRPLSTMQQDDIIPWDADKIKKFPVDQAQANQLCLAYLQGIRYAFFANWREFARDVLQLPVPIGNRSLVMEHAVYCKRVLFTVFAEYGRFMKATDQDAAFKLVSPIWACLYDRNDNGPVQSVQNAIVLIERIADV